MYGKKMAKSKTSKKTAKPKKDTEGALADARTRVLVSMSRKRDAAASKRGGMMPVKKVAKKK